MGARNGSIDGGICIRGACLNEDNSYPVEDQRDPARFIDTAAWTVDVRDPNLDALEPAFKRIQREQTSFRIGSQWVGQLEMPTLDRNLHENLLRVRRSQNEHAVVGTAEEPILDQGQQQGLAQVRFETPESLRLGESQTQARHLPVFATHSLNKIGGCSKDATLLSSHDVSSCQAISQSPVLPRFRNARSTTDSGCSTCATLIARWRSRHFATRFQNATPLAY
jgi:hypothetical protein